MLVRIIAKDDAWLENMPKTRSLSLACEKIWAEKSVQELWLPKSPTFSSVWMNRYQFAGPLRQSHPAKSISAVWEDLGKHGTLEHSIPLSFFPNLHCQPSPPFGLRKLMTAPCESSFILDWLRAVDDLYDATLEYAWGKFFPVWRKIRNYCFGIFNFDAELEWCKFRALTVRYTSLRSLLWIK